MTVHEPGRSECGWGTACAIRRGSAIPGGGCTGSEVRAGCEGHLGTQLIARVSKARLRIGAAVSADYPAKALEFSRLALARRVG